MHEMHRFNQCPQQKMRVAVTREYGITPIISNWSPRLTMYHASLCWHPVAVIVWRSLSAKKDTQHDAYGGRLTADRRRRAGYDNTSGFLRKQPS
ncbi:hypothetical protein DPMN_056127 [Dreissena polymorpha]|uniref:Uncharacterized protein n=1 Tax=Dreissena polymorpha TaxID=45954 RepID=A0A9D4CTV7_DREPO|nr:hypothetical protein DPMN_056127 [Dreissena polymorpha]